MASRAGCLRQAESDDVRTGDARVDAVLESWRASTSDRWRSTPPCSSRPTSGSVRPWTPTAARVRPRTCGPPEPGPVPRRLRLDAELVRRGLARSRDHAAELIAGGRVSVSGATADQAGHGRHHRRGHRGRARTRTARDYVSRGGHKLAGALAAFEPAGLRRRRAGAASTPARRPAASPTCCCGTGPARWWPSTSATASWRGRCAGRPGRGARPHQRPRARPRS